MGCVNGGISPVMNANDEDGVQGSHAWVIPLL